MDTQQNEVLSRWAQYFCNLLNEEIVNEIYKVISLEEEKESPDKEEIRDAINNMINFKAPGNNNLPAELFRYGGEELLRELRELFLKVWTWVAMPDSWKKGIIAYLQKRETS